MACSQESPSPGVELLSLELLAELSCEEETLEAEEEDTLAEEASEDDSDEMSEDELAPSSDGLLAASELAPLLAASELSTLLAASELDSAIELASDEAVTELLTAEALTLELEPSEILEFWVDWEDGVELLLPASPPLEPPPQAVSALATSNAPNTLPFIFIFPKRFV